MKSTGPYSQVLMYKRARWQEYKPQLLANDQQWRKNNLVVPQVGYKNVWSMIGNNLVTAPKAVWNDTKTGFSRAWQQAKQPFGNNPGFNAKTALMWGTYPYRVIGAGVGGSVYGLTKPFIDNAKSTYHYFGNKINDFRNRPKTPASPYKY